MVSIYYGEGVYSGLDAKHIVAHFHESEQVDFRGDNGVLGLREVELAVGQGLESLTALLLRYVASAFQVVKREDVLQFLVRVDDRARAVFLADLDLINDELLHVVRLLVSDQSRQVLHNNQVSMPKRR